MENAHYLRSSLSTADLDPDNIVTAKFTLRSRFPLLRS